jgi:hypothetical protein
MDDELIEGIDALVAEEHALHEQSSGGEALTHEQLERLRSLELRLDQCWDLLRQRRARRNAGLDPDDAEARPPVVVERYEQ